MVPSCGRWPIRVVGQLAPVPGQSKSGRSRTMEVAGPVTTIYSPFVAKRSNMIVRPGGAQTRVKLGIVGDYLKRFARASQLARDRIYLDGLAGSGTGIDPRISNSFTVSRAVVFPWRSDQSRVLPLVSTLSVVAPDKTPLCTIAL